jgi:hypothetical protein
MSKGMAVKDGPHLGTPERQTEVAALARVDGIDRQSAGDGGGLG